MVFHQVAPPSSRPADLTKKMSGKRGKVKTTPDRKKYVFFLFPPMLKGVPAGTFRARLLEHVVVHFIPTVLFSVCMPPPPVDLISSTYIAAI